jgi:hypothetical protein
VKKKNFEEIKKILNLFIKIMLKKITKKKKFYFSFERLIKQKKKI